MKTSELVSNTLLFVAAVLSIEMAQASHVSEQPSAKNPTVTSMIDGSVAAKSLKKIQLVADHSVNLNNSAAVMAMPIGAMPAVEKNLAAAKPESESLALNVLSNINPKTALPIGVWVFLSVVLCILRFKKRKMFA